MPFKFKVDDYIINNKSKAIYKVIALNMPYDDHYIIYNIVSENQIHKPSFIIERNYTYIGNNKDTIEILYGKT